MKKMILSFLLTLVPLTGFAQGKLHCSTGFNTILEVVFGGGQAVIHEFHEGTLISTQKGSASIKSSVMWMKVSILGVNNNLVLDVQTTGMNGTMTGEYVDVVGIKTTAGCSIQN